MKLLVLAFVFMTMSAFSQEEAPDTVRVGTYLISIHDINFHDKEYTARFWLWFLYTNPDFDPTTELDIPNAKTIESDSLPITTQNGKFLRLLKLKCVMKENWYVQDFPFDRQHLEIRIEDSNLDTTSLVFQPDLKGSTYDSTETIDGWTIRDFNLHVTNNKYETGFGDPDSESLTYSQIVIQLEIERNAWGLFMKIFLGMYIAFLISIISFTPHPSEMEPRFGLPVGGLFAAVGNKYIIDSLLPESSLFTLVDTLHALTFVAIFATLLVSAIALKQFDNGKKLLAEATNRNGAKIVVFLYLALNGIFIALALL